MDNYSIFDFVKDTPAEPAINILDFIPTGKENAIKRRTLAELLGVTDRQTREILHREARRQNVLIIGSPDGGYYKPETEEEIEKYIKIESARAFSINKNIALAKWTLGKVEKN